MAGLWGGSFLLLACGNRDIEVSPGRAEFAYKVIRIARFDITVIGGRHNGDYIGYHVRISSTTRYKEGGGVEPVTEKVFLNDHFAPGISRISVPETHAKFHIAISAPGYRTQAFDKTLRELKHYDNFHRTDDSQPKVWLVILKRDEKGAESESR